MPSLSNMPSKAPALPLHTNFQLETRQDPSEQLNAQELDIWEHAALLYHAYEWQAAADTFATLSMAIDCTERRALCLLNTGLIQARLGDYNNAASTIEQAAQIDQTILFTPYLLGLINYELRDFSRAEYCFELCLDGLVQEAVNYGDIGLDFELDRALLYNNLRAVRSAQFSASFRKVTSSSLVPMDALPAEGIFEAPLRSFPGPQYLDTPQEKQPTALRKLFRDRRPPSLRSLTARHYRKEPSSPASPISPLYLPSPTSPRLLTYQGLSSIPESAKDPYDSILTSSPLEMSRSPTWPSPVGLINRRYSVARRPITPYTPRDARGESESTKELAKFIRDGRRRVLIPKDAKGEYGSSAELRRFVQLHAPEKARSTITQPLDLDPCRIAELRQARVLDEAYPDPQSPTSLIFVQSPTMEREYDRPNDSRQNVEREIDQREQYHSDVESVLDETELRPSTVFSTVNWTQRDASEPEQAPLSPEEQSASDPLTPPSSASSSDSYTEKLPIAARRQLVRTQTLDALEGRAAVSNPTARQNSSSDKPLPPPPGSGGSQSSTRTPSSVATEDFFEKILGKGRGK